MENRVGETISKKTACLYSKRDAKGEAPLCVLLLCTTNCFYKNRTDLHENNLFIVVVNDWSFCPIKIMTCGISHFNQLLATYYD